MIFPLTRTGIVVVFAQSFIWTMGFLIQEQMMGKNNWPMAAAFSMVLVAGVACVIAFTRSMNDGKTTYHV